MRRVAHLSLSLLAVACGSGKSSNETQTGGPPPQAVQTASGDPRAALFLQKGCPQCHSISALSVKSQTEVGPDLTGAYEDVRSRFGVDLEHFLHEPTGTMQMVLSSMIKLTPAERDSIIHILKELHEQREERAEGNHQ